MKVSGYFTCFSIFFFTVFYVADINSYFLFGANIALEFMAIKNKDFTNA